MWSFAAQTYIYYHFTTLTGPNLAEQLQDEGFCHIPGKISHIPRQKKTITVILLGSTVQMIISCLKFLHLKGIEF